jgi:hypothetical protein
VDEGQAPRRRERRGATPGGRTRASGLDRLQLLKLWLDPRDFGLVSGQRGELLHAVNGLLNPGGCGFCSGHGQISIVDMNGNDSI